MQAIIVDLTVAFAFLLFGVMAFGPMALQMETKQKAHGTVVQLPGRERNSTSGDRQAA